MNLYDIERLTKKTANLNWAKNHYEDMDQLLDYSIKNTNTGFRIYAQYSSYGFRSLCEVTIQNDEVMSTKCTCNFHRDNDACGHVIAALFFYLDIAPANETFNLSEYKEATQIERHQYEMTRLNELNLRRQEWGKESSKDILKYFRHLNQGSMEAVLKKDLYKLEFEIQFEEQDYFYDNENRIVISARIGEDKLYVLKDFWKFFDDLDAGNYVEYGAKLSFFHHEEVFDSATREAFPYLRHLLLKQDVRSTARYLSNREHQFDEVFEMLEKLPVSYHNITLNKENLTCDILVEKLNEDTYSLSILGEFPYIISKTHFYTHTHNSLTQYIAPSKPVSILIHELLDDEVLYVSHDTLSELKLYFDSEGDVRLVGLDEERQDNIQEINLYLDVHDDELKATMQLEFDTGEVVNGFSKEAYRRYNLDALRVYDMMDGLKDYKDEGHMYMSLLQEETFRFLEQGIPYLQNYCNVFASDSLKNINRPTPLKIQVGVGVDHGLLKVDVSSLQVSNQDLSTILSMYRRKKKYHRLKNGEVINLESKDLEELDILIRHLDLNPKQLEDTQSLPIFRSFQLESDAESFNTIQTQLDQQVLEFTSRFKEKQIEDIVISENYTSILKDYQHYGVKWLNLLESFGLNGILADDMGLGKTLQVIAMLESRTRTKPSLVVCPASLMFNWEDELTKFGSNLNHLCVYGNKTIRQELIYTIQAYDVIITTYDYLKSDIELYKELTFDVMIIDEAQYIKNHNTKAAKSVKQIKANSRIALSGTPIENKLSELWSIFDYLMPGYLYSYNYFRTNFEKPVVLENDETAQKQLRALVEPFILRRTKKEVLDLPDKEEKILSFHFNEKENQLYMAKLAEGSEEVSQILGMPQPDKLMILKILNELRQLCCDPRLLYDNYYGMSSKMSGCLEVVESIVESDEKVLIFSSFTSILDLLEVELRKRNIKYHVLTGQTKKEDRKDRVGQFQEDDSNVFLMSLKAAGVGLNLTAAKNVIHFDPWWNLAAENQATDRTHRIGQTEDVQVFKLIMKDSIEEKILKMQAQKKNLSDMFIEGSTGSFSSLSKDEILDLFKK